MANVQFPSNPTVGQIFTTGNLSYQWDGVKWVVIGGPTVPIPPPSGGAYVGPTAPTNPIAGDLWWDTSVNLLKIYTGAAWMITGDSTGGIWAPVVNPLGGLNNYAPFNIDGGVY